MEARELTVATRVAKHLSSALNLSIIEKIIALEEIATPPIKYRLYLADKIFIIITFDRLYH
jgi:hypothetical protein